MSDDIDAGLAATSGRSPSLAHLDLNDRVVCCSKSPGTPTANKPYIEGIVVGDLIRYFPEGRTVNVSQLLTPIAFVQAAVGRLKLSARQRTDLYALSQIYLLDDIIRASSGPDFTNPPKATSLRDLLDWSKGSASENRGKAAVKANYERRKIKTLDGLIKLNEEVCIN
jgi:hypothetical protein